MPGLKVCATSVFTILTINFDKKGSYLLLECVLLFQAIIFTIHRQHYCE